MWQVIATGNSFSTLYLLNFKPDMWVLGALLQEVWQIGHLPKSDPSTDGEVWCTAGRLCPFTWAWHLMVLQAHGVHFFCRNEALKRESWSRIPACENTLTETCLIMLDLCVRCCNWGPLTQVPLLRGVHDSERIEELLPISTIPQPLFWCQSHL